LGSWLCHGAGVATRAVLKFCFRSLRKRPCTTFALRPEYKRIAGYCSRCEHYCLRGPISQAFCNGRFHGYGRAQGIITGYEPPRSKIAIFCNGRFHGHQTLNPSALMSVRRSSSTTLNPDNVGSQVELEGLEIRRRLRNVPWLRCLSNAEVSPEP
jgi:hypothetical protein